jgi:hypothetical protein
MVYALFGVAVRTRGPVVPPSTTPPDALVVMVDW